MTKLLSLTAVCCLLAYLSQSFTDRCRSEGHRYRMRNDLAYLALAVILILFTGLRTSYNDTVNYIRGFASAPTLTEFFTSPKLWNIFKNPAFTFLQSVLKDLGLGSQWLIFLTSILTQCCFLRFLKRYSEHFAFSVFLYFTLGTFCFTMAAMKQVTAMSILTLALPYLEDRKYGRYAFLVFLAMLFHTYAIIYLMLPLFRRRPWSAFTYFFMTGILVVFLNFEAAITGFMEQANDLGKTLADYEIFDNHGVNTLRLMVYAVPPLLSFLFQKRLFRDSPERINLLVHMSIISLGFMALGTNTGANMFGRMSSYFEIGTLCVLPWMLKRTFNRRSYHLMLAVSAACFLVFFVYANGININFAQEYHTISLRHFLLG